MKKNNEFKALELKFSETSTASHFIYFKEHLIREHTPDRPSGRTLFVINIPPYVDKNSIKTAFSEAGRIISVQFVIKPNVAEVKTVKFIQETDSLLSFKIAYVVFEKVSELDKALTLSKLKPVNSEENMPLCGLNKWITEYNQSILEPKLLKEKIDTYMEKHDKECKEAEIKNKQAEQEDDEGWITVTKRGKVQSFSRSEKVENKIMAKEEKNKKRKELKNFYTFQIRESKMKHIVSLRRKFEEDKKKIAHIKQSRRFKPF